MKNDFKSDSAYIGVEHCELCIAVAKTETFLPNRNSIYEKA